jgi:hypothetical protein
MPGEVAVAWRKPVEASRQPREELMQHRSLHGLVGPGVGVLIIVGALCGSACDNSPTAPSQVDPGGTTAGTAVPTSTEVLLEAENGTGAGGVKQRSAASNSRTAWLRAGETRTMRFTIDTSGRYALTVRYSNDNGDTWPCEVVEVRIDDAVIGSFTAKDTGSNGFGWDVFEVSAPFDVDLAGGAHMVAVTPTGGDTFGIEIDVVRLVRQ